MHRDKRAKMANWIFFPNCLVTKRSNVRFWSGKTVKTYLTLILYVCLLSSWRNRKSNQCWLTKDWGCMSYDQLDVVMPPTSWVGYLLSLPKHWSISFCRWDHFSLLVTTTHMHRVFHWHWFDILWKAKAENISLYSEL